MTTIGKGQTSDNQLFWVADNVIAHDFPDVNSALRDPDGLLAIGGCLSPDRLLDAYQRGIFPWFSQGQPILWWSPNPRCVLEPDNLKVSRSLRKTIVKDKYSVTFNKSFKLVVKECAKPRSGSTDTWITSEMMEAYVKLHELGHAISVECWNFEKKLVGGLYGVVIGKVFFGESMFSRESDTSKIALIHLLSDLKKKNFRLVDCQVHSKHLQSLGAKPIPRDLFISVLKHYCQPIIEHQWPQISEL